MAVVSTRLPCSWAGASYGGEEGVLGQVREVGAEAVAALDGRMLCELLRWEGRFGGVHGAEARE